MVQYSNLNSVMEIRDHFKNGASLKSQMSKRNFKMYSIMRSALKNSLWVVICLCFLLSCSKTDSGENKFPSTNEEIQSAVETSKYIATQGDEIINSYISDAYSKGELVDVSKIVNDIKAIEGVKSAMQTPSGTGVVIEQNDGIYTNLFIVTQDNYKMFTDKGNTSQVSSITNSLRAGENEFIIPSGAISGNGKALILAPFQAVFKKNLVKLKGLFESAGYHVDMYTDNQATLERFRGSFLSSYDIVFIDTHGAANFKTVGGSISTVLATGEEVTTEKMISLLSSPERLLLTVTGIGDKSYFVVSAQWLRATTTRNFPNSWFFASACESYQTKTGDGSMASTLLNLGVIGFNGYKESILADLAGPIAEKMASDFTSGKSFSESSKNVLSDGGLKARAWWLRLRYLDFSDPAIDVNLFDYNNTAKPFYLIDPDSIVGEAKVIPSSGVVGTPAVYQVIIKDKFASLVQSIEFDIDNTGEHLTMTKQSYNTWIRDGLAAPSAQSYPRIDTFTFSAYDSNKKLLGRGSATFSILQDTNTMRAGYNSHYYGKE